MLRGRKQTTYLPYESLRMFITSKGFWDKLLGRKFHLYGEMEMHSAKRYHKEMINEMLDRVSRYCTTMDGGRRWRPFSWNPFKRRPAMLVGDSWAYYTYPKHKLSIFIKHGDIADVVREKKQWFFFKGSVTAHLYPRENIHDRRSDGNDFQTAKGKAWSEFRNDTEGYSKKKREKLDWTGKDGTKEGIGLAGLYYSKKLRAALESL